MKEKRLLPKKERLREVPAQAPSLQGLSSFRVKAPIERKQGHLNSAVASHMQTHTHAEAEQHQGQRECSECTAALLRKPVLFRLTAMCKE